MLGWGEQAVRPRCPLSLHAQPHLVPKTLRTVRLEARHSSLHPRKCQLEQRRVLSTKGPHSRRESKTNTRMALTGSDLFVACMREKT